jgi:hypothetical protein
MSTCFMEKFVESCLVQWLVHTNQFVSFHGRLGRPGSPGKLAYAAGGMLSRFSTAISRSSTVARRLRMVEWLVSRSLMRFWPLWAKP